MDYIYENQTVNKDEIVSQINKFEHTSIIQIDDKNITII